MNNELTEENIKKLREELDYRMTVKRAEIAKEKLIAAAHGDRSENAEYKEACANYRENDNRIQYLMNMISTATVIEDAKDKSVLGIPSEGFIYLPLTSSGRLSNEVFKAAVKSSVDNCLPSSLSIRGNIRLTFLFFFIYRCWLSY